MNEEKESRSSAMSEQKRTALLRYMMDQQRYERHISYRRHINLIGIH